MNCSFIHDATSCASLPVQPPILLNMLFTTLQVFFHVRSLNWRYSLTLAPFRMRGLNPKRIPVPVLKLDLSVTILDLCDYRQFNEIDITCVSAFFDERVKSISDFYQYLFNFFMQLQCGTL